MNETKLALPKNCLAANLRAVSRQLTQFYDAMLAPSNLSITQFTLLISLSTDANATVNELAQRVAMNPTTLNRDLKPLKKQGLVKVEPGEEDQRTRVITITEKGEQKLLEALPLWEQAQTQIVGKVGGAKADSFLRDLFLLFEAVQ